MELLTRRLALGELLDEGFDMRSEGRTGLEMRVGAGPRRMEGWPYTDLATGWYAIADSSQIKSGEVKPMRWFRDDLVVFRTESGRLSVLDAYGTHIDHQKYRVKPIFTARAEQTRARSFAGISTSSIRTSMTIRCPVATDPAVEGGPGFVDEENLGG